MEKEIVEGKIGSAGDYGMKFMGSKLVAQAELSGAMGPLAAKATVAVELNAIDVGVEVLTWLKGKVNLPGQFDEMAFDLLIAEVKKLEPAIEA